MLNEEKTAEVTPWDISLSLLSNDDPNSIMHKKGRVCPGALLIALIERFLPNPVFQYFADFNKNPLVVPKSGVELKVSETEQTMSLLSEGQAYVTANFDCMKNSRLLVGCERKFNFQFMPVLSYANLDLYCQSMHIEYAELKKKYGFELPTTFCAAQFIKALQSVADVELITQIKQAEAHFPGYKQFKIYRKQWVFADPSKAIRLPTVKHNNTEIVDEDKEFSLDIRVGLSEALIRGPSISATYDCAIYNKGKPYMISQTTGAVVFIKS